MESAIVGPASEADGAGGKGRICCALENGTSTTASTKPKKAQFVWLALNLIAHLDVIASLLVNPPRFKSITLELMPSTNHIWRVPHIWQFHRQMWAIRAAAGTALIIRNRRSVRPKELA